MKFISLAGRNLKEGFRDPIVMILALGQPILFLLLFNYIGSSDPNSPEVFSVENLVPGIIIFSFGFLTIFSALLLAKDRQNAFLVRLLIAPLKLSDFLLAYITPFIPIALTQVLICYLLGVILGLPLTIGHLVGLLFYLPAAVICICLGIIFGSLLSENAAPPAGSLAIIIVSLFGGAWMDLKMIGGIFETVGYALPFAHAVDAARFVLSGSAITDLITELTILYGYMLALLAITLLAFWYKTKP